MIHIFKVLSVLCSLKVIFIQNRQNYCLTYSGSKTGWDVNIFWTE